MSDWLNALLKFALSFRKRSWGVDDYPLRFKHQPGATVPMPEEGGLIPWHVQIVNWWTMGGVGNTRAEAYDDLKKNLASYWSTRGALPRPGSRVPIEFASQDQVQRFEAIARDFLSKILKLDLGSCLITDESSLSDFGNSEVVESMKAQIRELYDVDVSDIADGNLVSIFRRIHAAKRA